MIARHQREHEAINAREYPGTRQLCCVCDQPTGRCEEDSIYLPPRQPEGNELGPLCEECAEERFPSEANSALSQPESPHNTQ